MGYLLERFSNQWCFYRSAGKRSARSATSAVSSAPLSRQHTATQRSELSTYPQSNRIPCPIALRQRILGLDQPSCRCSRHYIPQVMDIEYDEFIQMEAPESQIIVIAVISSLWVVHLHFFSQMRYIHFMLMQCCCLFCKKWIVAKTVYSIKTICRYI